MHANGGELIPFLEIRLPHITTRRTRHLPQQAVTPATIVYWPREAAGSPRTHLGLGNMFYTNIFRHFRIYYFEVTCHVLSTKRKFSRSKLNFATQIRKKPTQKPNSEGK